MNPKPLSSTSTNERILIPDSIEIELDEFDSPIFETKPPSPKKSIAAKLANINNINGKVLKNLTDVANVSDVIGDARDVFHTPTLIHKHNKNS